MTMSTIQLNRIPEFNNIHLYFESAQDLQEFLKELPADRYPQSELKRLRLIPQLEVWLEQSGENRRTFFGLTLMHTVPRGGRWRRAELFRCLAIKMADGEVYGFKSPLMNFERGSS